MTESIKEIASLSRLLAVCVVATGIAGAAGAQTTPGGSQTPAGAQTTIGTQTGPARTITLEEAINIALRQNSTLVQAENAAATADIAEKQAQMRFLPTFNALTSTSNAVGRNFSQEEGKIITQSTQTMSAGLSSNVTLFDGFANVANLRGARLTSAASDFDLERARETVVFDVLTKYLALIQAQEQLGVQRQNLAAQEALLKQIDAFVTANKRPIADQYTQQASVASARVQELQSRRAVEIAKLNIVGSLRLDPLGEYNFVAPAATDTVAQLSGTMQQIMTQALTKRVDLSAQQKRLEAAEQSVKAASAAKLPSVSMNAGYNTGASSTSDLGLFDQFNQRRGGSVGLSFSIPIFDRYTAAGNTERAKLQLDNQRIALYNMRQSFSLKLMQAIIDLKSGREQLEAAEAQLKASDLALKSSEERYRVGAGTLTDVTQARASNASAASAVISARYNLAYQRKVLDYYTGALEAQSQTK
jgi:outer membrane protein